MKKVLRAVIYLILFSFSFHADAQNAKSPGYIINGRITGVDSGKIYTLSPNRNVIDSAAIVKGKFIVSGKLDLPERKAFKIQPGNWEFGAFVDAPHITFDLDTAGAEHYYSGGKDSPMIMQIKETGSPLADVYAIFIRETGKDKFNSLSKKLKFASKDSAAVIKNKMDSLVKSFPEKLKFWVENYVQQNPTSIPGIYFFQIYYNELSDKSPVYLRSMLTRFSGPAKASSYYQELMNKLSALENVQVGKPAPDFTLLKRDKQKFKLTTTRGSVVMLDFWASWCVPCRAAIPNWKKVYAKYHLKGFNIISISDDRNWGNWIKALDKEKMPWTQVVDEYPSERARGIVGELYTVYILPNYVLIDKKGEIVMASGDEHAVMKKIKEILK
jgi:peroxiredoxin